MSIDNRLLIKQVKARPALWNRHDSDYCHKTIVSKLWADIAAYHGAHESKVKNKWKALRDTFRQELKKPSQPTTWSFYQDMSFLRGHMKTNQTRLKSENSDDKEPDGNEESGTVKHEPEDRGEVVEMIKSELEENYSIFVEEDNDGDKTKEESLGFDSMDVDRDAIKNEESQMPEKDDDYHFFMSFLPEMKKLQPRRKILLRIKILELLYKEIYQQDFI